MAKKPFTDIFDAARKGTIEDVRYFVEKQVADVNAKDSKRNTPLHTAVQRWYGDNEMIEYLISRGANVLTQNKKCRTAYTCALIKLNCLTADIAGKAALLTQMEPDTMSVAGIPIFDAMDEQLGRIEPLMKVIKMLKTQQDKQLTHFAKGES